MSAAHPRTIVARGVLFRRIAMAALLLSMTASSASTSTARAHKHRQRSLSSSGSLSSTRRQQHSPFVVKPLTDAATTTAPPTSSSLAASTVAELALSTASTTAPPGSSVPTNHQLFLLQAFSFLFVLSTSLVAFSPAPALSSALGAERATAVLSAISSSAALLEMIVSPTTGLVLDSFGRKPVLVAAPLVVLLANTAVWALPPSIVTIGAAKFVTLFVTGAFYISCQTATSDLVASHSSPQQLSAVTSVQRALIGCGFLVGALLAGILSSSSSSSSSTGRVVVSLLPYGISTVTAALTVLLVGFGIRETLPVSKRVPFHARTVGLRLVQSPLSAVQLLVRHGPEVRMLGILLALQSLPMFMGDIIQIYARKEWNLSTKTFSSSIAMIGLLGILANMVGSVLVQQLGIRLFTSIATFSALAAPLGGALFGYRGLVVGAILGFLGGAQQVGISAALILKGQQSGLPQGELAGERSSLLALIKVIGPLWYSTLYLQGQKQWGVRNLPFLFNAALAGLTFVLIQLYRPL